MFLSFTGRCARYQAILATAMLASALVTPAVATAAEPAMRTVKVSDLDLTSTQGQLALDRRLRLAIEQVCSPRSSTGLRHSVKEINACRREARKGVDRQLTQHGLSPLLASGH
jgi:UrcA family protein